MVKAKTDKLTLKHIIDYGTSDCGGCFGLWMMSGYMSRFLQVNNGRQRRHSGNHSAALEYLGYCERSPDGHDHGHLLHKGKTWQG